ncbi:MAG: phosphoglycolate phosphatase [Gammaproteobacteria bacterium]|nr:phosphoglycolate phosphatase [Gammaproteobacteria bacterium]
MLKKPKLVLIDVDGTLVDSVPDLGYCVNSMMRELDMPEHAEDKIREWVGNGVERLVRRALIGQLDGEPDDELFHKAYPLFLDCYAVNTSKRSALYPGIREGLDRLHAQDYVIGCVTNKAAQFTVPLLKDLGIYDDFAVVVAGDTLDKKKPDPAPLLYAAERMGIDPQDCLMVGDSISDVKAARAAGFQIVCMPYGYNHGVDIREANPDAVIDSLAHLDTLLADAA